jgi:multidrug resistance efflux pump
MRDTERRRAYLLGYRLARRRAQRELALIRESHDELRSALAELRAAVAERRAAEAALVMFYRDAVTRRDYGTALHEGAYS